MQAQQRPPKLVGSGGQAGRSPATEKIHFRDRHSLQQKPWEEPTVPRKSGFAFMLG